MPRGVKGSGTGQRGKRKPIDSKIAEAKLVVDNLRTKLNEAEKVLAEYEQQKKNTNMESLLKLMEEKGVSPDQLSAILQNQPAE